jgi:hypothetical protein
MGNIKGADVEDEVKGNEDSRVIILVEGARGVRNPQATLPCEPLETSKEPGNSLKDGLVRKASVHVLHVSTEEEERGVLPKQGMDSLKRAGEGSR